MIARTTKRTPTPYTVRRATRAEIVDHQERNVLILNHCVRNATAKTVCHLDAKVNNARKLRRTKHKREAAGPVAHVLGILRKREAQQRKSHAVFVASSKDPFVGAGEEARSPPTSRRRRRNGTGQEASSCRLRAAPGRGLSVSPRSRPRWPCSGARPTLQPSGPALLWSYHHQAARPAGPWPRHYWGRTWAATPRSGASAAPPRPLCVLGAWSLPRVDWARKTDPAQHWWACGDDAWSIQIITGLRRARLGRFGRSRPSPQLDRWRQTGSRRARLRRLRRSWSSPQLDRRRQTGSRRVRLRRLCRSRSSHQLDHRRGHRRRGTGRSFPPPAAPGCRLRLVRGPRYSPWVRTGLAQQHRSEVGLFSLSQHNFLAGEDG